MAPQKDLRMAPQEGLRMAPQKDLRMAPQKDLRMALQEGLRMAPQKDLRMALQECLRMATHKDLRMPRIRRLEQDYKLSGGAYYMVVSKLPAQNYSSVTNNSENKDTSVVTINCFQLSCTRWNFYDNLWTSQFCRATPYTVGTTPMVNCICDGGRVFSGGSSPCAGDRMVNWDLFELAAMEFTELTDHTLFLTYVLLNVYMVFFALLYWAWKKDRLQQRETRTHVLPDLFSPYCPGNYMICIVTGIMQNCGTTSVPSITLVGENSVSFRVSLAPLRGLFQTGSEVWFLLSCNKVLGNLTHMLVSLDQSGNHKNWFISHIFIRDLRTYQEWYCIFDTWLPDPVTKRKFLFIPASKSHGSQARLRLHTFLRKIRKHHLLIGIFYNVQGCGYSKTQHALTCLFTLLLIMCIILFSLGVAGPVLTGDDYREKLRTEEKSYTASTFVAVGISSMVSYGLSIFLQKSNRINEFNSLYWKTSVSYNPDQDQVMEQTSKQDMDLQDAGASPMSLSEQHEAHDVSFNANSRGSSISEMGSPPQNQTGASTAESPPTNSRRRFSPWGRSESPAYETEGSPVDSGSGEEQVLNYYRYNFCTENLSLKYDDEKWKANIYTRGKPRFRASSSKFILTCFLLVPAIVSMSYMIVAFGFFLQRDSAYVFWVAVSFLVVCFVAHPFFVFMTVLLTERDMAMCKKNAEKRWKGNSGAVLLLRVYPLRYAAAGLETLFTGVKCVVLNKLACRKLVNTRSHILSPSMLSYSMKLSQRFRNEIEKEEVGEAKGPAASDSGLFQQILTIIYIILVIYIINLKSGDVKGRYMQNDFLKQYLQVGRAEIDLDQTLTIERFWEHLRGSLNVKAVILLNNAFSTSTYEAVSNGRLQQLRVKNETDCKEKYKILIEPSCHWDIEEAIQETRNFAFTWEKSTTREVPPGPYTFTYTTPFQTVAHTYPSGGRLSHTRYPHMSISYQVMYSLRDSKPEIVDFLKSKKWVDVYTRAVRVHLALFNADTKLVTSIEHVYEFTAGSKFNSTCDSPFLSRTAYVAVGEEVQIPNNKPHQQTTHTLFPEQQAASANHPHTVPRTTSRISKPPTHCSQNNKPHQQTTHTLFPEQQAASANHPHTVPRTTSRISKPPTHCSQNNKPHQQTTHTLFPEQQAASANHPHTVPRTTSRISKPPTHCSQNNKPHQQTTHTLFPEQQAASANHPHTVPRTTSRISKPPTHCSQNNKPHQQTTHTLFPEQQAASANHPHTVPRTTSRISKPPTLFPEQQAASANHPHTVPRTTSRISKPPTLFPEQQSRISKPPTHCSQNNKPHQQTTTHCSQTSRISKPPTHCSQNNKPHQQTTHTLFPEQQAASANHPHTVPRTTSRISKPPTHCSQNNKPHQQTTHTLFPEQQAASANHPHTVPRTTSRISKPPTHCSQNNKPHQQTTHTLFPEQQAASANHPHTVPRTTSRISKPPRTHCSQNNKPHQQTTHTLFPEQQAASANHPHTVPRTTTAASSKPPTHCSQNNKPHQQTTHTLFPEQQAASANHPHTVPRTTSRISKPPTHCSQNNKPHQQTTHTLFPEQQAASANHPHTVPRTTSRISKPPTHCSQNNKPHQQTTHTLFPEQQAASANHPHTVPRTTSRISKPPTHCSQNNKPHQQTTHTLFPEQQAASANHPHTVPRTTSRISKPPTHCSQNNKPHQQTTHTLFPEQQAASANHPHTVPRTTSRISKPPTHCSQNNKPHQQTTHTLFPEQQAASANHPHTLFPEQQAASANHPHTVPRTTSRISQTTHTLFPEQQAASAKPPTHCSQNNKPHQQTTHTLFPEQQAASANHPHTVPRTTSRISKPPTHCSQNNKPHQQTTHTLFPEQQAASANHPHTVPRTTSRISKPPTHCSQNNKPHQQTTHTLFPEQQAASANHPHTVPRTTSRISKPPTHSGIFQDTVDMETFNLFYDEDTLKVLRGLIGVLMVFNILFLVMDIVQIQNVQNVYFENREASVYINFDDVTSVAYYITLVSCLLASIIFIKVLLKSNNIPSLSQFLQLVPPVVEILYFPMLTIMCYALMGHRFFFELEEFSTYRQSCFSTTNMFLNQNILKKIVEYRILGMIFIVLSYSVMNYIVINYFIVLLSEHYSRIRGEQTEEECESFFETMAHWYKSRLTDDESALAVDEAAAEAGRKKEDPGISKDSIYRSIAPKESKVLLFYVALSKRCPSGPFKAVSKWPFQSGVPVALSKRCPSGPFKAVSQWPFQSGVPVALSKRCPSGPFKAVSQWPFQSGVPVALSKRCPSGPFKAVSKWPFQSGVQVALSKRCPSGPFKSVSECAPSL
ncbi:hypothetical protein Btru_045424 [Bulinus truncatus]|nr:hypothetical protein Btru_045424 [Bulinus truncatus]